MADKIVIIRVMPDTAPGGPDEVVKLLTGEDPAQYVGMIQGKIVIADKAHALRYRLQADDVEAQIAEVKRLYGKTWVAEEVETG